MQPASANSRSAESLLTSVAAFCARSRPPPAARASSRGSALGAHWSRGATTSGSTKVSHRGAFFELHRETASISFAIDPRTGRSGEAEYHARSRRSYQRCFQHNAALIDEKMESFRAAFGDRAGIVPWDPALPDRCKVSFATRWDLIVDIAFGAPPSSELLEPMRELVRELFVVRASLVTADYQATLQAEALATPESDELPAATRADEARRRAQLEQTLAESRSTLDAYVAALRAELPLLPYDPKLPLATVGAGAAPCRFEWTSLDLPKGADLALALASSPTSEQSLRVSQRLHELALAQVVARNSAPPDPPRDGKRRRALIVGAFLLVAVLLACAALWRC